MKKTIPIASMFAVSVFALVSCEQPSRVVDRPLGYNTTYPTSPVAGDSVAPPLRDGSSLLDDVRDPSTPGMPVLDPTGGTNTGGNTISNMIDPKPPVTNTGAGTGNTIGNTPSVTTPKTAEIPYAWPDPSDPNVVRSPYDRSLKIRITKPDGTRYPSGTVMWDPNFKAEKKQFKVP